MRIIEQEYEIKVDFNPENNDPVLIYKAMAASIEYLQKSDDILAKSISKDNKVKISLHRIKEGSLRSFIRSRTECPENELQSQNDEDDLEIKVKEYFARGKRVITQGLLDLGSELNEEQLEEIASKVDTIAKETRIAEQPFYILPSAGDIKDIAVAAEKTASLMDDNSRILYIGKDEQAVELPKKINLEKNLFNDEMRKILKSERNLILKVKKPDFLGDSRWEMKHGKNRIVCKIVDEGWINRFKNKEVLVFPGDSLECVVEITEEYDELGNLIKSEYQIKEVENVIEGKES